MESGAGDNNSATRRISGTRRAGPPGAAAMTKPAPTTCRWAGAPP